MVNDFHSGFCKLRKGKALREHSLHVKTAASVLLKLFMNEIKYNSKQPWLYNVWCVCYRKVRWRESCQSSWVTRRSAPCSVSCSTWGRATRACATTTPRTRWSRSTPSTPRGSPWALWRTYPEATSGSTVKEPPRWSWKSESLPTLIVQCWPFGGLLT